VLKVYPTLCTRRFGCRQLPGLGCGWIGTLPSLMQAWEGKVGPRPPPGLSPSGGGLGRERKKLLVPYTLGAVGSVCLTLTVRIRVMVNLNLNHARGWTLWCGHGGSWPWGRQWCRAAGCGPPSPFPFPVQHVGVVPLRGPRGRPTDPLP